MTVYQVMNISFVDDHTVILIRDEAFNLLGGFVRIHPFATKFYSYDVKSFSWWTGNHLNITVCKEAQS